MNLDPQRTKEYLELVRRKLDKAEKRLGVWIVAPTARTRGLAQTALIELEMQWNEFDRWRKCKGFVITEEQRNEARAVPDYDGPDDDRGRLVEPDMVKEEGS